LPVARNAGKFLGVLWTALDRRIGSRCARLREGVVHVWLTRSGEGGGETFDRHIYVYDLLANRTDLEWARELAHEMGHVLLPSPSNYSEPESWGNGVLGERLFLHWLRTDMAKGEFEQSEIAYATKDNLDYYCRRQVDPLIERVRASGPDAALLSKSTKQAMDAYTALMLYASEVYGPTTILDLLERLPSRKDGAINGADFLTALEAWLGSQRKATAMIAHEKGTMVYLSKGKFNLKCAGADLITMNDVVFKQEKSGRVTVSLTLPGWQLVKVRAEKLPANLIIEPAS
jgi:hypothetical protein